MNRIKLLTLALLLLLVSATSISANENSQHQYGMEVDASSVLDISTFSATVVEDQMVKASYSDPAMLAIIAEMQDLREVPWDKENKQITLETSAAQRELLLAAGFELTLDEAQTLQLHQSRQSFIQRTQQAETRSRSSASSQPIPGYACYRTVEETLATGAQIANNYPNIAEWIDVGNTWNKNNGSGGYDMMVLRLTNEAITTDKPRAFFMSALHAREYTTAELNTRFAEQIVTNYGTDPDITWLLDHHEIHLLLQANPDGRKIAETGASHRKNGNTNACGTGNVGIDLNRNFSFEWNDCGVVGCSSGNVCSDTYRGSSSASEPETEAIENYLRSLFPDQRGPNINDAVALDASGIYLDIHSSGELIVYPWGSGDGFSANNAQFEALSRKLGGINGYRPVLGDDFYPVDGASDNFGYGELGVASMTIELGTAFFEGCSSFESDVVSDNISMLTYAVKASRAPYALPFGPEANNVTVSANSVTEGDSVTLNASVSDTRYNNQNGVQPTQNITAAEYYIDTPPWMAGAVAMPMSAADGNFNSKTENATASLDTTGLSAGQHTIYVRGQDADGNWGVMTAQFVDVQPTVPSTATTIPTQTSIPPTATNTPIPPTATNTPNTSVPSRGPVCTTYSSTDTPIPLLNGVSNRTSSIIVPTSSTVQTVVDVNVSLNMSHEWVGDLIFTVGHNGTNVIAIDRPGVPTSTYGCSQNDIVVTLDDEASSPVETQCANSVPTLNGTFKPNNALTAFDNQTADGTWTLEAKDAYPASDQGALNSWEIEICTVEDAIAPTSTPAPPTATPIPPTPTATPASGGDFVVYLEDFEGAIFWTLNPQGTDTAVRGIWQVANPQGTSYQGWKQLEDAFSGVEALVTGANAGSSVGRFDVDGGVTSIQSPAITLPPDNTYDMNFAYYFAHTSNSTVDDFFRISVIDATGNKTTIYEEVGDDSDDDALWEIRTAILTDFAGQTINLLIEAADGANGSIVEAGLDTIEIVSNNTPSILKLPGDDLPEPERPSETLPDEDAEEIVDPTSISLSQSNTNNRSSFLMITLFVVTISITGLVFIKQRDLAD